MKERLPKQIALGMSAATLGAMILLSADSVGYQEEKTPPAPEMTKTPDLRTQETLAYKSENILVATETTIFKQPNEEIEVFALEQREEGEK